MFNVVEKGNNFYFLPLPLANPNLEGKETHHYQNRSVKIINKRNVYFPMCFSRIFDTFEAVCHKFSKDSVYQNK